MSTRRHKLSMKAICWAAGLLLGAALGAGGQEPEGKTFVLAAYPFDVEEAKEQIDAMCNDGLLPVGLEVDEGAAINVLYAENDTVPFSRWFLYNVVEFENLEADLSYLMKEGWLPMGLSRSGVGLYVLFINADKKINSWRITRFPVSASDFKEAVESYMTEGFLPYGISVYEENMWVLFLQVEGDTKHKIFLGTYQNEEDSLLNGISLDTASGKVPWGLMVQGSAVSVLYLY
jgi:hypothetical protein